MKITIEKHGESVSIDAFEDCLTTYQVVEVMHRMCHALGYHSQNIAEAFCEIGEEMIETDEH
jgi:deoxyhypusine synthase